MALENRPAGEKALKKVFPDFFINNNNSGIESLERDMLLLVSLAWWKRQHLLRCLVTGILA